MAILIRHGHKGWKNGRRPPDKVGYSHDPPLEDDLEDVRVALGSLPERIICSPFLRCRQTAEQVSQGQVPIEYDPDLREYLGNWKKRKISLDPTTWDLIKGEKVIENYWEFQQRMERIREKGYLQQRIWVITHGMVIEHLTGAKIEEGEFVFWKD